MEWISVKDQLPPEKIDVLLWVDDDQICYEVGYMDSVQSNGIIHWETNSDLARYRDITHWTYLPEPPKD